MTESAISRLRIRLTSLMRSPGKNFDNSDMAFGRQIQMLTTTIQVTMHFFTILLFSSFRDSVNSSIVRESIFSMRAWNNLNRLNLFRLFMDYPGVFSKDHHFDAICFVLFNQYMKPMQDQTFKQFLIAAMVHVMIKRNQMFPPHERDAYVTFFPDPKMMAIIYDMLQSKEVFFSSTVLLKKCNEKPKSLDDVLKSINSVPNETHRDAISRILELKPDFFQKWQPSILEYLHSGNDVLLSAKGEKKWIEFMQTGCPEFLAEMQSFRVESNTIRWIFFYTIQWNLFGEFNFVESLDALMNHLVFKCPMPFPFMSPPRIFTKDYTGKQSGDRGVGADLTEWGQISVRDLKTIFFGIRGIREGDIPLHEHKGTFKPRIKLLSSLLYAFRMRQNAMSLYAFQLKYAKALPVIQEGMRKRFAYNIQCKSASILILLAIKRRSDIGNFRILKAMADIVRFGKIPFAKHFANHARNVQIRLEKFDLDLQCHECPICLEDLSAVKVDLIQPCGHILCNSCLQAVGFKCPSCRTRHTLESCKGVVAHLSDLKSPVFFPA